MSNISRAQNTSRGMSLVEVIIAAAVVALIFGGLFASFQLMISLIGKSKAESGALALANEQIEYIRSLPYDDVGTVGGIPDGSIPQVSTTTLNGVTYTERVLIAYVDSADDGTGAADANGIVADYKLVKVEYSWSNKGVADSLSLISNIVPKSIETTAGGGTLTVNVFDAAVQPVADAEVHVYNDTGTTTIDTIRYTNVEGVALISGAPAGAGYQLTVTKDGFSTDGTYSANAANPNPSPPPVAVLENEVSTVNFQIDQLSDLAIRTIGVPTTDSFQDSFNDSSGVEAFSNTVLSSDAVTLTGAPSYVSSGTVRSIPLTPATFSSWSTFSFTANTPTDTSVFVHLYSVTGTSTYALVSDTDLPGNSTGFATGTIAISTLDPVTFPTLALGATLATSDASTTPELLDWTLAYVVTDPPIGNIPVGLRSNKTIGTYGDGSPVYKYQATTTTDSSGDATISDLEWDVYNVTLGTASYDIAEACGDIPYTLEPGVSDTLTLTLAPVSSNSLRVRVEDVAGDPIPGASVDLTRPSFSASDSTSACGQVFFSNLSSQDDYQLVVSAAGYTSETIPSMTVDGATSETIVLSTP